MAFALRLPFFGSKTEEVQATPEVTSIPINPSISTGLVKCEYVARHLEQVRPDRVRFDERMGIRAVRIGDDFTVKDLDTLTQNVANHWSRRNGLGQSDETY